MSSSEIRREPCGICGSTTWDHDKNLHDQWADFMYGTSGEGRWDL